MKWKVYIRRHGTIPKRHGNGKQQMDQKMWKTDVKIGGLQMEMKRWPVPGLDEKDDKDEIRHKKWE